MKCKACDGKGYEWARCGLDSFGEAVPDIRSCYDCKGTGEYMRPCADEDCDERATSERMMATGWVMYQGHSYCNRCAHRGNRMRNGWAAND